MILPALKRGAYTYLTQQQIGERFGGGKHFVDVVAEKEGKKYLVSLKWQQVSGTAEQKVTLTNAGTVPLTINSVTPTGTDKNNFVTANTCGSTVAAGANCAITVTFKPPSTAGIQSATLEISDSRAQRQ